MCDKTSHNVVFENNNLTVVNGARGIRYLSVAGGLIQGNSIFVKTDSDTALGIQMDLNSGVTVSKNNIHLMPLNPGGFYVGIDVEQAAFLPIPEVTVLISENNIYKSGPVGFYDTGIAFFAAAGYVGETSLQYCTIDRNNVTGFQYGITDGGFVGEPPSTKAKCNIYSNNFANGNGQNYDIDTSDPVNSIFLDNNVVGCVNPDLAPAALVASLDVEQYKAKRLEMFKFKTENLN